MLGYWLVTAMCLVAVVGVVATIVSAQTAPNHARPALPIRVAVLGASDVTGEGLPAPDRQNWVAQLAATLPAGVDIRRFGIGGDWLAVAQSSQVPAARQWKPDIVVCWLIVNDLTQGEDLEEFATHANAMMTAFAADGTELIVGNCPQLWTLPAFAGDDADAAELRAEVERWNRALGTIIATHGAAVVDLSLAPTSPADVLPDGLHPDPSGHARLAAAFGPAVLSAIDRVHASRLNTVVRGHDQAGS